MGRQAVRLALSIIVALSGLLPLFLTLWREHRCRR
jgi:hypothetical protein